MELHILLTFIILLRYIIKDVYMYKDVYRCIMFKCSLHFFINMIKHITLLLNINLI